jgi:phage terminase large subunit-like protein
MKSDVKRKVLKALDEIKALHESKQPYSATIPSIETWTNTLGIVLDPWQYEIMTATSNRTLILCPRQTGKSFVSAMYAAYSCLFSPGKNIIIIAPTLRQSRLLFATIDKFIVSTREKSKILTRNTTLIELAHGGKVTALPGDKPDMVRGMTADLVLVDEAAFVRDDVLAVILPMLATTNGKLLLLSTPSGPEGVFYRSWNGEESWDRRRIDVGDCPRITKEFLDDAKIRLGKIMYSQEYECQFLQSAGAFFDAEAVNRIFGAETIGPSFSNDKLTRGIRYE